MNTSEILANQRFPRTAGYNPDWIVAGASGGANPLWLMEWLTEAVELKPGMRVLDLGCGRALSSVFLHREFGVQVWAADLWFSSDENRLRIRDAGAIDGVIPVQADARQLPFEEEFFDVVLSVDSFMYYGTDDLFLNHLLRYLKPGGTVGICLAGFLNEVQDPIPNHLEEWWQAENPYFLHSGGWWRRHWEKTGLVDVSVADMMPDGWTYWRDWLQVIAPENKQEIRAIERDAGCTFGYVRLVAKRHPDVQLFPSDLRVPENYQPHPLSRK